MPSYITESIEAFGEDVSTPVTTASASHLYKVNPNDIRLPGKKRQLFHSIAAKLLFLSKRGRPDMQPTVAFLTTRATKAYEDDEEDWKKMGRLLQYLNATIDLSLTISADSMTVLKTWVDSAYAVHPDMKSQTGGTIMMGKGVTVRKIIQTEIEHKSSTEAERR